MGEPAPKRLQLSRAKGFNLMRAGIALNGLPTVNVARPGKWGNPYFAGCGRGWGGFDEAGDLAIAAESPETFARWFGYHLDQMRRLQDKDFEAYIAPLRGKNVACWCALDAKCHGDHLLWGAIA